MGTETTPLDSDERDLAAAELNYIALANRSVGGDAWKEAVLKWHCEGIARARAEAWIPGMALSKDPRVDPRVQELLARYYGDQIGVMLRRLKAENLKLRRHLIDALKCIRFNLRDRSDIAERSARFLRGSNRS